MNNILSRIGVEDAAKLCNLSKRTIRDWRRGKFSMDLDSLKKLCRKSEVIFPKNVILKNDYWYTKNFSSAGGIAVYKKYGRIGGDPEYRKKRWYKWWYEKGQYNSKIISAVNFIKKPKFSENLAEFVGIVLGDGSITQRQITISLNAIDDRDFGKFVVSLIKRLFDVPVGTYYKKEGNVINYSVSRSELVRFCVEKLGLKKGNKIKQQVDIPDWIKRNSKYSIACVRGLFDTDGCVFTHSYKSNGKSYSYKKLAFTSYSNPLRKSVFNILKKNKLNPRMFDNRDIRIDSIKDVKAYFDIFGSHNPKHLKRYKR
ncbi:MAG: hypothetical protein NTY11_02095 [Candidatus Parcubacteria bacterium]|nr:hypothetical protein [Candidatus Parcubacteria bacterium]